MGLARIARLVVVPAVLVEDLFSGRINYQFG